jgi:hypothetical protein
VLRSQVCVWPEQWKEQRNMAPIYFYLHITAVSKMGEPPLKLQYGPYSSVGEAHAKFADLIEEPGYEYTVRVDQKPDPK